MEHCYVNWMLVLEYVKVLFDFLKVFFAWPVAALILGATFIKVFRNDISEFLKRVTKLKGPGTEVEASLPAAQAQAAQAAVSSNPTDPIEVIASDPKQAKEALLLLRDIANFEQTFNPIFGTQMTLMHVLRSQGAYGADASVVDKQFQEHLVLIGSNGPPPTLETYLAFLFARGLVVTHNERLVITENGNRFVDHIVKTYAPPPFRAF